MSETQLAKTLLTDAIAKVEADPQLDADAFGRALINVVIEHSLSYRSLADVKQELQYTLDNLDEDEFVITRGC